MSKENCSTFLVISLHSECRLSINMFVKYCALNRTRMISTLRLYRNFAHCVANNLKALNFTLFFCTELLLLITDVTAFYCKVATPIELTLELRMLSSSQLIVGN